MIVEYRSAPSALFWTDDLFSYIQAQKAGTFDGSAVYEQFSWLIVPEVTAHGASGAFAAYFAVKAPDPISLNFSVLAPITDVSVWNVVDHAPVTNMLYADHMSLSFLAVLSAPTAQALEKLIFQGDDRLLYHPATADSANDVLQGWGGNDNIEAVGSGGRDRFYGGDGNDRISIYDGLAGTTQGARQTFFGYGGTGNDTVQGDDWGDHLFGGGGRDTLSGFEGADVLSGGAGRDSLAGGSGSDVLNGGTEDDILNGGLGVDAMTGGSGADRFIFTWGGTVPHVDSGVALARRDVITDFVSGQDKLQLLESALAHVTLIGQAAFTGVHQVRWITAAGDTTVYINTGGTLAADMAITLQGVTALDNADFMVL